MGQVTDAIVLGFAKSPPLIERSFAPLRRLRQEGALRNVHYVTWDSPELDHHVAPVLAMADVQTTRVPQPAAVGSPAQKGLAYQIHNLEQALSLIPENDAVVLKSRPDFIMKVDFLRDKVSNFACNARIDPTARALGVSMPAPIFKSRIWTPWADSNQPFFYEDGAFLGRKDDLLKLAAPATRADMDILGTPMCAHYCHIVRFVKPFLDSYPMFKGYLQHYRHLTCDLDYRVKLIPHALNGGFFLFLVVAHAWVLHSHFHVDCGEPGDIRFYANAVNKTTDWEDENSWRVTTPYGGDDITGWREGEVPGQVTRNLGRPYGRLMDDAWQEALFTKPNKDVPRETLVAMLEHISQSRDGRLDGLERDFYADLARFHRDYMQGLREKHLAAARPRPAGDGLLTILPAM